MNSVLFFVDAGFLSELSKHFGGGKYLRFDYSQYFRFLAKKKNLNLEKVFYYTAPPFQSERPSSKEISRRKGYDNFINKLKKDDLFVIREGRLQNMGGNEFKQKGVDTLMTMDLAFSKDNFSNVKNIIIFTSDTDFVPVIQELRKFGIKVLLCTFVEKKRNSKFYLSVHLLMCCDEIEYLKKEDMIKFSL